MWFSPDWCLPKGVHAAFTDRTGGHSVAPFAGFNLGQHVGDDSEAVALNRSKLSAGLGLTNEPVWLNQVHGTHVETLPTKESLPTADASYTDTPAQVCCVMTADCVPVLFVSADGLEVAAAHAGWRGLCDGILEHTVAKFSSRDIRAWIGPCISKRHFEVGPEVRQQFIEHQTEAEQAFTSHGDKFLGDLPLIVRQRLERVGITDVTDSQLCTYANPERFFSYRRDRDTGRLACLIWR